MMNRKSKLSKKIIATAFLSPMIPTWVPKRRYPQSSDKPIELEFMEIPRDDKGVSKECAICRRIDADYEHACGVAFHKACIEQYFHTISGVDGAERICPHCYAPVPLNLEVDKDAAIEVSIISDDVYNQYLEISDEFSLAIIEGSIRDISVFLNSKTGEQYFVNIDFDYYPKKPAFSFPDDLLTNILGLSELLEDLNNWDEKFPPRLVDVLLDVQSRIISIEKEEDEELEKEEFSQPGGEIVDGTKIEEEKNGYVQGSGEEIVDGTKLEEEKSGYEQESEQEMVNGSKLEEEHIEYVEVLPEEEMVEVEEVEEILPATFFEIENIPEFEIAQPETASASFENEEAIQQYLNLSNSFSVELVEDEIYHVIVYLSCLDAGIYNIYPITINFRDYPKKPMITFTDDFLVRVRNLDNILENLKFWDPLMPHNLVDIIQQLELRLVEDSTLENELEVIKREYKTQRMTKNRILVTLSTYGPRFIEVELDVGDYPSPPKIILPEYLKELDIKGLEGIRNWQQKPQKRIMDVLRSLTQTVNNHFRMEFEESLLKMVSLEFEAIEGSYRVVIPVSKSIDEDSEEGKQEEEHILLLISVPGAYPLIPPEIEVDADSALLRNEAQDILDDMLKSWAPSMFLADAANKLSLSLSSTSLFKCIICGETQCPTCGLPLLTQPVEETKLICEMPCIHCKRPFHVHCLTRSIGDGISECGYCLTDLGNFLGKRYFKIIG